MIPRLRRVSPSEVETIRLDARTGEEQAQAAAIVEDVRNGGEDALRRHSERLGDIGPGQRLTRDRGEMRSAFEDLDPATRDVLMRAHRRIEVFARAQRDGLADMTVSVDGGRAGHRYIPVASVGAYAPGGRYPLPSSVLMTVTPARVAGVTGVWVASPRPSPLVLAAAWVAGADGVLAAGGAQAVAALAFGTVTPKCDMVVGPGNRWVTAAKKHLYGEIGIDGLAGPSEIVVIADGSADPRLVAADMLAQAEHDADALPGLVTDEESMVTMVEEAMAELLGDLPSAEVATAALANGFAVVVPDLAGAARVSDSLAPEHLAVHVGDPVTLAARVRNYGSVFVGSSAAEAFADYGVGPNHVLPTGGGARFTSGLSVLTFLRAATWLTLDDPDILVEDTVLLARLEGLEAHARAALARGNP